VSDQTIEELLAEFSDVYTREQFMADRTRLLARLCAKHGITEPEVDMLIRAHRYVHSAEDPEDEYIQIMTIARNVGWV
jgi:hypothetical protein